MGNTLALKAAILILFSIYIYVAGFSYTALVANDDFASSVSTYVRIFLLALIFLLMGIQGEVKKIQLYFIISVMLDFISGISMRECLKSLVIFDSLNWIIMDSNNPIVKSMPMECPKSSPSSL